MMGTPCASVSMRVSHTLSACRCGQLWAFITPRWPRLHHSSSRMSQQSRQARLQLTSCNIHTQRALFCGSSGNCCTIFKERRAQGQTPLSFKTYKLVGRLRGLRSTQQRISLPKRALHAGWTIPLYSSPSVTSGQHITSFRTKEGAAPARCRTQCHNGTCTYGNIWVGLVYTSW